MGFETGAYREYQKLDGSVVTLVDKKLAELEYRADEVGKFLVNKENSKLSGCREVKLRDAGIRIVYKITGEKVDILRIVYILTIEKRADDYVFTLADKRLINLNRLSSGSLTEHLKKASVHKRKK